MTKRKFTFDVTGRQMFASEEPIVAALNAKYGRAASKAAVRVHVVSEESHARKVAAVREALRQNQSRSSALFEVVTSIHGEDPAARRRALEKYAGIVSMKSTKIPRSKLTSKLNRQKGTAIALGRSGKVKPK